MLLLPGYKFRDTDSPLTEGDSILFEADVPTEKPACPVCGHTMRFNGPKPIDIHDVSQGRAMVKIRIYRKQFVCSPCNKHAVQKPPLVSEAHLMTERLVDYIEQSSSKRNFSDVADELGIAPITVSRIFEETAAARIESMKIEIPEVMGIDSIRLGRQRVTAIVNIKMDTIVEILEGHDEDVLSGYFEKLSDTQKANVSCVAMDPWDPFRRAVSKNLSCRIVLDRFHALAMAENSMEAVRKHLRKTVPWGKKSILKGDQILLKQLKPLNPVETQNLNQILNEFPLAADARKALVAFSEIWEASNQIEGKARIDDWLGSLNRENMKFYKKTAKTITNWKDEAIAYFIDKETNAMTESMNKKIRTLFNNANGLSFKSLRNKLLLTHAAKVTRRKFMKPPLPKRPPRDDGGDIIRSVRFSPSRADIERGVPLKPKNEDLDTGLYIYDPDWESIPANVQMLLVETQDYGVDPVVFARELEEKWIISGSPT